MSKYAIGPNPDKPLFTERPDTLSEVFEQPFYSFKYSPTDGYLTVEKILENEPIILPSYTQGKALTDNNDVNWFSSSKKMVFKWLDSFSKTHLYLEVE